MTMPLPIDPGRSTPPARTVLGLSPFQLDALMIKRSQRGAARVNIVWPIVLLVGMLVGLAYGFVSNDEAATEKKSAKSAIEKERKAINDLTEVDAQLRAISEVAGFYDEMGGAAHSSPESMVEGLGAMRNALPDMDPSVVNTFEKAAVSAIKSYNQRVAEVNQLKGEVDQLRNDISAKEQETRQLASEKDRRITELESQLRDAEQAAADRQSELEGQLATARDTLRETDKNLRMSNNTIAENSRDARNEEQKLRTRLREQGKKLDFLKSPEAADGTVLAISQDLQLGWIDLGTTNRLARGTRFRVVDAEPGSMRVKAWAEVTRVTERMAEVLFTDQLDPFNPVVAGDYIFNPIYDPKGGRDAVLVGRFSGTFNEKELGMLLADIGVSVQSSIDERTDYLILGSELYTDADGEPLEDPLQPTDLPEYKEAEARGVVIVPLKHIREYFRK